MPIALLMRLAGLAAMVAGGLRIGASFVSATEPSTATECLYLMIDVSILFALIGIYAYQYVECGGLGFVGFVLSVVGIESIGGPDGKLGDMDVYWAGATVISVGLLFLAAGSLKAGKLPRYTPYLWIASTLLGMTTIVVEGDVPFLLAGVTFGLGFIGAGIRLWTQPALQSSP